MSDGKQCEQCGASLAAEVPYNLCPACLMRRGLEADSVAGEPSAPKNLPPPTPAALAAHFPDLEILELLGRGGMGAVYKARQKRLDRIVALKILPPSAGEDPSFAERFEREAQALAKLNHPHIVTLYEFGQAAGLYYFLMEYVDGVHLRQLLRAGKLAPKEALAIVPQICEALQFAHDHGIVHRDIKPENILLNKAGQVKIADFGLAKIIGGTFPLPLSENAGASASPATKLRAVSLSNGEYGARDKPAPTEAGRVVGTPQYMAPEQVSRPGDVDHRADIYSLGVVFYQMLTGELPAAKLEPPSRKVQIDVRLDEVVLRALEKEPGRRYQQVSEVRTQVETIVATPENAAPINSAPPAGEITLIVRWAARALALLALVFILLFIAAQGYPAIFSRLNFQAEMLGLIPILVGAVAGWWAERAGAVLMLAGWGVFCFFEGGLPPWPINAFLIPAALYAFCGWPKRSFEVRRPRPSTAIWLACTLFALTFLRLLVLEPYYVKGDAVAPEVTDGSQVFIFKLAHSFRAGDIVIYRSNGKELLGRVAQPGPTDGHLLVERNLEAQKSVPTEDIKGRVIFNTRAAPSNANHSKTAANGT
jgi:predicted Ser/Thr protein kinase